MGKRPWLSIANLTLVDRVSLLFPVPLIDAGLNPEKERGKERLNRDLQDLWITRMEKTPELQV
jgi:hypothetical protein